MQSDGGVCYYDELIGETWDGVNTLHKAGSIRADYV